jgi:hypothetical protein
MDIGQCHVPIRVGANPYVIMQNLPFISTENVHAYLPHCQWLTSTAKLLNFSATFQLTTFQQVTSEVTYVVS